MQELLTNNKVIITGEIFSKFTVSHEVYGEIFYNFTFKIPRLSDQSDYVIITASGHLLEGYKYKIGDTLCITGQFRSYNNYSNTGNKLILTVFAKELKFEPEPELINSIYLNGYVCKPVIYRTTPFGREIADILVAVNRTYNKSDYIPCIAWGRNAKFASAFSVGDNIKIQGRIQSREYQKKINDEETITKTAYEVSISKLDSNNDSEIITSI